MKKKPLRCRKPAAIDAATLAFLERARVAHLATADAQGRPHGVPICFVCDGRDLFTPLDEKPKQVPAEQLRRVRNLRANPHVAVVVDTYDEDWSRLGWVMLFGIARLLRGGTRHAEALRRLEAKYPQYRAMGLRARRPPIIWIRIERIVRWGAVPSHENETAFHAYPEGQPE